MLHGLIVLSAISFLSHAGIYDHAGILRTSFFERQLMALESADSPEAEKIFAARPPTAESALRAIPLNQKIRIPPARRHAGSFAQVTTVIRVDEPVKAVTPPAEIIKPPVRVVSAELAPEVAEVPKATEIEPKIR